jgi:hypothetical protein
LRRSSLAVFRFAVASALFAGIPAVASAQLRPLEPIPWRLFTDRKTLSFEAGASRLNDQRASLAGESGVLWEVANFSFAWKTGRVVIEAAGTAQRIFAERSIYREPFAGVEASDDGRRNDSGDYRISTAVRLTPDDSRLVSMLRFGTRLPTTDNTAGLDRDAIDFFATVGAASGRGPLAIDAEAGLGIHTSRNPEFEQDDLLLYALRTEYSAWRLVPSLAVLGQMHGTTHRAIRGLENLGELRAGLRAGRNHWVRAEVVKGYESFSPSLGFILTAGMLR